jgi:hypothetical protein
MIEIDLILICDGCGAVFTGKKGSFRDLIFRRDIEAIRHAAYDKGWRRFRLSNTSANGDYCPPCQRRMAREKKELASK